MTGSQIRSTWITHPFGHAFQGSLTLFAPLSDWPCAYKLFDGDDLYLLVHPNGRKSWRFRYVKPDGREGLNSFGNYPVAGLADARKKRLEVKRMLAEGIDPTEFKYQAKTLATI